MAEAGGNLEHRPTLLPPGTLLANTYRLDAVLGAGAFGVVWLARHEHLHTECAVKVLNPPPGADPQEASARFLLEARVLARLKCPNVVQVLDFGLHGQTPFLVLELLRGVSLASHLRALREQGRRLSPEVTANIIAQVAEALDVAHRARVVHRDLKPDNIFLAQDGERQIAKVLDFGIAKWSSEAAPGMTATGTVMGTPHYMSPEQFESARGVDHRADLWSLGVVAFECVTGQLPFPGDTFMDVAFKVCKEGPLVASRLAVVPLGFEAWFARSTAHGREYRFRSALEQASALQDVCRAPAPGSARGAAQPVNPPRAVGATPIPVPPETPAPMRLPRWAANARALTRELARRTLAGKGHWWLGAAAVFAALLLFWFTTATRGALVVTVVAWPSRQEVSGVEVLVDDELRCGASPCQVERLRPGTHHVNVRALGFQETGQSAVAIVDGQTALHDVQLIQAGTGIKVFGEGSGLTLLVDGTAFGPLPLELRGMEPGEHVIQVTAGARYEGFTQRIVVEPGRMTPIGPIRLRVIKGLLTLRAGEGAENAELFLNVGGNPRSLPALPLRLEVETDRPHELVARRKGFTTLRQHIVFEDGQAEQTIEISLSERPDNGPTSRPTSGATEPESAGPVSSKGAAPGSGHLPAEVIRRVVSHRFDEFHACYEQGLKRTSDLAGRVVVRFVIGRDGATSNISTAGSDLPDADVVNCIVKEFNGLSFPKPDGGSVTVSYPIQFEPE